MTSGSTSGDVPDQPLPPESAETKLAQEGGETTGEATEETSKSYPESGGKTYLFRGSTSDLGEISPVASIKTTRGDVARGETIELSDEEAEALKKAGFDLAEEGGDG